MMNEAGDDLAWDYTGDEGSPLFQRTVSPMYSGERSSGISRRQARYLLHTVTEAARVLRGELNRERFLDIPSSRDYYDATICQRIAANCRRFMERFSTHFVTHIPAAIVILVILAVICETIWDAQSSEHKPIIAAILCGISFVLLLLVYAGALWQATHYYLSLLTIMKSYLCSVVLFAAFNVVFHRYNNSSWASGTFLGGDFISSFCRSIEFSVSIFTLCSGRADAVVWYTELLLTFQMLSAYCHTVLLITMLVLNLPAVSPYPMNAVNNSGGVPPRQTNTPHYDVDTDSIGPFGLMGEGSSGSNLATRRPAEGASAAPTQVPRQDSRTLSNTGGDLYISNSV